jgi:hypothetical protein
VWDMTTNKRYSFFCDRWAGAQPLAVDKHANECTSLFGSLPFKLPISLLPLFLVCSLSARWLAKDEDDGLIRRRLTAMTVGGENTNYRVVTYTSDIRGAGTDANVYCYLCGEREAGKEIWGPLQKLDDTKNNFERNQVMRGIRKGLGQSGDERAQEGCNIRIRLSVLSHGVWSDASTGVPL